MSGGPIRQVAVVVPAADEQERIGACLHALDRAVAQLREARGITASVTVVLDCCSDETADIVARFPGVHTVVSTARCVGAARGLGSTAAFRRSGPLDTLWTAHTDADSKVPGDWLTSMVAAADAGADLVLGTVLPAPTLPLATLRAWHRLHDADDGHPHVHGANLGIRARTLAQLGGWRPLATGEDVDLTARAHAAGAAVLSMGGIAVHTSSRADGRAPEGFSSYLRALA